MLSTSQAVKRVRWTMAHSGELVGGDGDEASGGDQEPAHFQTCNVFFIYQYYFFCMFIKALLMRQQSKKKCLFTTTHQVVIADVIRDIPPGEARLDAFNAAGVAIDRFV